MGTLQCSRNMGSPLAAMYVRRRRRCCLPAGTRPSTANHCAPDEQYKPPYATGRNTPKRKKKKLGWTCYSLAPVPTRC